MASIHEFGASEAYNLLMGDLRHLLTKEELAGFKAGLEGAWLKGAWSSGSSPRYEP